MASNSTELIIWGIGVIALIIAYAMIDAKFSESKEKSHRHNR